MNLKVFPRIYIASIAAMFMTHSLAQESRIQTESLPTQNTLNFKNKVFLFPWISPGLDPNIKTTQKDGIRQIIATLETLSLSDRENLADLAKKRQKNLSLNAVRKAKSIWSAQMKGLNNEEPLFLQPIFCDNGEFLVVSFVLGNLQDGLALAVTNRSFTKQKNSENLTGLLMNSGRQMWDELTALANQTYSFDHRFKLGISSEKGSFTSQVGGSACLNLLMLAELLKKAPVVLDAGYEHLSFTRRILSIPTPLAKSNKRLHIEWKKQSLTDQNRSFLARFTISDAIFAGSINDPVTAQWETEALPNNFLLPESLNNALDAEISKLKTEDWPMIAKIVGAWAYLDRGRAWGLAMADRLVVEDQTGEVKGHIVGFYGSEAKITSPRGFGVTEGAIMFVRKGQRKTQLGQIVRFDPVGFPSAWPPQKNLP